MKPSIRSVLLATVILCGLSLFAGAPKIALIAEGCRTNGMVTVRRTVTDAIVQAGYVPLVLPDTHKPDLEDSMLDRADALVIFGGLKGDVPRRVEFEKRLIRAAAARKMPIVGFCHGLQTINRALGGTIHRNPTNVAVKIVHHDSISPYVRDCFHSADVKPGTLIARALGEGRQRINTSHYYSIDKLADGFEVTATAEDGVIEAVEHRTLPITAFQFHPERLSPSDPRFAELIRLALERR